MNVEAQLQQRMAVQHSPGGSDGEATLSLEAADDGRDETMLQLEKIWSMAIQQYGPEEFTAIHGHPIGRLLFF